MYADQADVKDLWDDYTEAAIPKIQSRIGKASRLVDNRTPLIGGLTVAQRVAASPEFADTVKDVVVEMVLRVLRNPEGARQKSVTVDDATESTTIDSALSSGEMFISDDELADLMGIKKAPSRAKAFTITPSAGRSWCR